MNSDSGSLQNQLLSRLLAEPANPGESMQLECEDNNGAENFLPDLTAFTGSDRESGFKPQTFLLGEIPTVQERFQAVLKRRLQVQIEDHPPLFPWETQLVDYPECADEPAMGLVPTWGWAAQQSKLNLPMLLPEKIFRQLLDKCQALITSSLPLGPKLVQAVESFFPNESQVLNDLAGCVLMSPYRSVDALEAMPNLDSDYSDLQPRQQMALSLLAAKQLLESLTLPISTTNPLLERQWLTSVGVLNLKVAYQSQGQVAKLRIQGHLPSKGVIKLQGSDSQARAESSGPGSLSVELCCTQLNEAYTLTIELKQIDQQPLLFVIIPTK